MRKLDVHSFFLVCLIITSVACQGEQNTTQEPVVNITTPALAIQAEITTAPEPTLSPIPSPIPSPSPPQPTVTAPSSPTPTTTHLAAPTATPFPTRMVYIPPAGYLDPQNFPATHNPFTGQPLPTGWTPHRPVAIKVSNYPPLVRPQWGLNKADLVFEHYAEGQVTRFTALYYANLPNRIGSVRSGRLIDIEIPQMYDAAFAYSGASGPIKQRFQQSSFFDRIISPDFGHDGFVRYPEETKSFEHTLYTSANQLTYLLELRGENRAPQLGHYMAFSEGTPANGQPARRIEIAYGGTNAFWSYQPQLGRYLRWTDGELHSDAEDMSQLSFRNVIVIYAHHQTTDILEDQLGNYSIEIQIWGYGPLTVFRDGQQFDGRWERSTPEQMLTFTDAKGNPLPLAVGNSFIQVVPLDFQNVYITE